MRTVVSRSLLSGGKNIAGDKVLFMIYDTPSDSFFVPALTGAQAAAAITGVHLVVEYGNSDDSTMANEISTAVASKYSGLALDIPDSGLNKAVCAAAVTKTPIVAFNIDGLTGPSTKCALAFVGQSFKAAGEVIGADMVKNKAVKPNSTVFCPVEFPTATYAVQRAAGVNEALKSIGAKCAVVGVGADYSTALATMVQYLLGHRSTTSIISLGNVPNTESYAAAQQARVKVKLGGFDLTPTILKNIASGHEIATVNQDPYAQGYYAVMQLALDLKYSVAPSDINTGNGLVDRTNVALVNSLVPTYQ